MQIETVVSLVTVFTDRAQVTRLAQLEVAPGTQVVVIDGLPGGLDPASLRAFGKGTAAATLVTVETRQTLHDAAQPERLAELERELESLEDQDAALADQQQTLEIQVGLVRDLAQHGGASMTKGIAFGKSSLQAVRELLQLTESEMQRLQKSLRTMAQERRALARQIEQVRHALKQLETGRSKRRYQAEMTIHVEAAGTLELGVSYVIQGAGWTPLYDARATDDGDLCLAYGAHVWQRTGEDWSNVQVTLSTAPAALAPILPTLGTWYIQPRPEIRPQMAQKRGLDGAAVAFAAAPEAMAEAAPMMDASPAVREEQGNVSFVLPAAIDVPSDGSPHRVNIGELTPPAALDFVTAPKTVPHAYRRLKAENSSPLVLLPGQVSLFWGEDYVGSADLERVGPNQAFELFLGVDDRLIVERDLLERAVDRRVLANRRKVRFAYGISVSSAFKREISIEVIDQLPVSRHEDAKVEIQRSDPKPAESTELGILTWRRTLAPGETWNIDWAFNVDYPREMDLIGLP